MGCGGSKVDDQPLVILCRERKELIKAASYHRSALAAAHLAYFQSLCDVGESIKRFVDEELVLSAGSNNNSSPPDSPVLTLPSDEGKKKHKISSSSTSVSHSVVEEDDGEGSHLHLSSGSEFDSGSESGSDDSLAHHIHIESSPKVLRSNLYRKLTRHQVTHQVTRQVTRRVSPPVTSIRAKVGALWERTRIQTRTRIKECTS